MIVMVPWQMVVVNQDTYVCGYGYLRKDTIYMPVGDRQDSGRQPSVNSALMGVQPVRILLASHAAHRTSILASYCFPVQKDRPANQSLLGLHLMSDRDEHSLHALPAGAHSGRVHKIAAQHPIWQFRGLEPTPPVYILCARLVEEGLAIPTPYR
jgi:hypothetical protein